MVVYSPQFLENYTRQSAEGLSVSFVVIWLLGDFFNLTGAVLARLLPTVIILALYVSAQPTPIMVCAERERPVYVVRYWTVLPDILLPVEKYFHSYPS
jgi:hypothetical protein